MKCENCSEEVYYWYVNKTETFLDKHIRLVQWFCPICNNENREYY